MRSQTYHSQKHSHALNRNIKLFRRNVLTNYLHKLPRKPTIRATEFVLLSTSCPFSNTVFLKVTGFLEVIVQERKNINSMNYDSKGEGALFLIFSSVSCFHI